MKLYKNKYLIGVYAPIEEGETLIALCDNAKEFAELLDVPRTNADSMLTRLFNGSHQFIRFLNKCCKVEFIDMEEE